MDKERIQGNFSEIPFSYLLFSIWKSEKSGNLKIKKGKVKKNLDFQEGNIAVVSSSINMKQFLENLISHKVLDFSSYKKCNDILAKNNSSPVKKLIENKIFSPASLWKFIENYIKLDLFPIFDWQQAEYSFETGSISKTEEILFLLPTLDFVLEGVRLMKSEKVIKNHLPQDEVTIHILSPDYLNKIKLNYLEKYIISLIEKEGKLKKIFSFSELGEKETQKIIFALLSLEIASYMKESSLSDQGLSKDELRRIIEIFNKKCFYISKYISKEIGPVAINILGKCIEDIRPSLSNLFKGISLDTDGKVLLDFALKKSINFQRNEIKKAFLNDLDEILAAEILAVKKTLGNEHESILVKNLEKIEE